MIILYNTHDVVAASDKRGGREGGRGRERERERENQISAPPNGCYYYYYSIVLDQCLLARCDAVSRDFIYPHTHTLE